MSSGGTEPVVRRLSVADVPDLVALEQLLFGPSAWNEVMVVEELTARNRWYVGIDGPGAPARRSPGPVGAPPEPARSPRRTLVGYAGSAFDGEVVEVMTIGVAPHAQRQGLGKVLLDALVSQARTVGAQAVLLEVRVDNDPAIALYERTGFAVVGRRRRYYQPEDVDAWTMRKEL
ncbi:ribosomal protein S18-alanine N-acetyltransferase [Actinotalea sp.]|uniref:ribosomal protein S18-alanine N-acetyltransferase n=1 Tax=Actinotalea sp. TaxID=1872145 RepID=UPI00356671DB